MNALPRPNSSSSAWRDRYKRARSFVTKEIWDFNETSNHPLLAPLAAVLRVLTISLRGLHENSLFSRAASLSYASMLALGPIVALSVVIATALMPTNTEEKIKEVLLFIAPTLQEMATSDAAAQQVDAEEYASALDVLIEQILSGGQAIINEVNTGGSTLFGALGSLILIGIVIQLMTSVETTLNHIWGVRHGRPWSQRIVFYWTFLSLGVLLGLGATALFSAGNIASMFDWMPFAGRITELLLTATPLVSFAMLTMLLALFYRFFPNTAVNLRAALVGGAIAAFLLLLNNYLSFLYLHRVISLQSLYGSVGIIPVLMVGLYFFWVFVLLGGQVTYAIQNAHFLNDSAAWRKISPRAFELIALATFLMIARRYRDCETPPDSALLGALLHVPQSTVNEAITHLEELNWITRVTREDEHRTQETFAYQPARPLEQYNLSAFRQAIAETGHCDIAAVVLDQDGLLSQYDHGLGWHKSDSFFQTDLRTLLNAET